MKKKVLFHCKLSPPPHLPCLVMIISVWYRWNLSHRGRLQRYTWALIPEPALGSAMLLRADPEPV